MSREITFLYHFSQEIRYGQSRVIMNLPLWAQSDISWYSLIYPDIPWYILIFPDISWYSLIYPDIPWYIWPRLPYMYFAFRGQYIKTEKHFKLHESGSNYNTVEQFCWNPDSVESEALNSDFMAAFGMKLICSSCDTSRAIAHALGRL